MPTHVNGRSVSTLIRSIGIRREDKSRWERRAPLTPEDVKTLIDTSQAKVYVQPSTKRIFRDEEYIKAGAILDNSLDKADLILGVKEVPIPDLIPNKNYLFFSHTHKGQLYNMPMLQSILDKNIRLIDYELMVNHHQKRVVMFGKFAGYAGLLDGMHGLGHRFLGMGYSTPFLNVAMAHNYRTLDQARESLHQLGEVISDEGTPKDFGPLTFTFTGNGNVSKGAQELFKILPHEYVDPKDLPTIIADKNPNLKKVYAAEVNITDHIRLKEDPQGLKGPIDVTAYRADPSNYFSNFADNIAPYSTMIVNGAYWDQKFPHLMTTEQLAALQRKQAEGRLNSSRLACLADISCDVKGAFEFMSHVTTIDDGFYYVNAAKNVEHKNPEDAGIQVMSIDILPTELPVESSQHFSRQLLPYLQDMVTSKGNLPSTIENAVIASERQLAKEHEHLYNLLGKKLGDNVGPRVVEEANQQNVLVLGSGFVVKPLVEHLSRLRNVSVTIDIQNEAKLANLVASANVVVSLVPATLHTKIAKLCIEHRKHMVTASYVSPEMKALNDRAERAGITIMNEVGLDPGIDHMSAMRIIDEVQKEGGKTIPGESLLQQHFPAVNTPFAGFNFEGLANRNSLSYAQLYGLGRVEDMDDMMRGTLRYKGYSDLMNAFRRLGFLDTKSTLAAVQSWSGMLATLLNMSQTSDLRSLQYAIAERLDLESDDPILGRVYDAMKWMGLLSSKEISAESAKLPSGPIAPLDAFCHLLSQKLKYGPHERDMVMLHHEFGIEDRNGNKVTRTSTLVQYGSFEDTTAMAKTVGLPAALATQMIFENKLPEIGVRIPTDPHVYNYILDRLEESGVKCVEKTLPYTKHTLASEGRRVWTCRELLEMALDEAKSLSVDIDKPEQQTFVKFYRGLPRVQEGTIRLFERDANQKRYYTFHGDDALYIAQNVYKTLSVVKYWGGDSTRGLPSVNLSANATESFLRDALITKQLRVEIWGYETGKPNQWKCQRKASPGNLQDVEDFLFANTSMEAAPIVMSAKIGTGDNKVIGVCFADASARDLGVAEFVDNDLFSNFESLVIQLGVKECIIMQDDAQKDYDLSKLRGVLERCDVVITHAKRSEFNAKDIEQDLNRLLEGDLTVGTRPEFEMKNAMSSAACLINYLKLLNDETNYGHYTLRHHDLSQYMRLDASALRALNLMPSPQDVQIFVEDTDLRQSLQEDQLKAIPDMHRLAKRFQRGIASLQDVVRVYQVLIRLPGFLTIMESSMPANKKFAKLLQDTYSNKMKKLQELVETTIDLDAVAEHEFMIKPNFDDDLLELRDRINDVRERMSQEHVRVGQKLDLDIEKKLKMEKHQVYGYCFRIGRGEASLLRNKSEFIEYATQKAGTYFTTSKMKDLSSSWHDLSAQYDRKQNDLVKEVIAIVGNFVLSTARKSRRIDRSFGCYRQWLNEHHSIVLPTYLYTPRSRDGNAVLRSARHPCLEVQDDVSFIPNDVNLVRDESEFQIITGPNMGGKSTYIRQIGVIALMAQAGCFVPCSEATLCIFDSILARVGAGDSQLKGVSTFMAEMLETATILKSATANSLIIIDELGRGTSTYDGFGLAWAIADDNLPHVRNLNVAVHVGEARNDQSGRDITLLYKVNEGVCDQSFGIHVAELANFPPTVVNLAKRKVDELEEASISQQPKAKYAKSDEEEGRKLIEACLTDVLDTPDVLNIDQERLSKLLEEVKAKHMPLLQANPVRAGELLASEVAKKYKDDRHEIVLLGLPRGGVPVAFAIAEALQIPLDVMLVRKIGMIGAEEVAMGAVTEYGVVRNEGLIKRFNISEESFDTVKRTEEKTLRARKEMYRSGKPPLDLAGKVVVLVDDGIATGATMRAAYTGVKGMNPKKVVVAAPVGEPDVIQSMQAEVDDVICLLKPPTFRGVGMWYASFEQTEDREVIKLLNEASKRYGEAPKLNHNVRHEDRVWQVSWNPVTNTLASCSGDKTVRIWMPEDAELKAWKCVNVLEGAHNRTIRSVAWNPSGTELATASFDATTGIWDRDRRSGDWECVATLEGHENEIKSVAWSGSGQLLATCSRDKSVWIWEAQSDNDFECLSVLQEHTQDVKMVTWHPSEELLASASYDDTIKIWREDEDDWYCSDTLQGHSSTVWSIDFRRDGEQLVSGSDDQTLKIWRRYKPENAEGIATPRNEPVWKCICTLSGYHSRCIYGVSWSKVNGCIASVGGDNNLRVFRQDVSGSVDEASPIWNLQASIENAHGISDINAVSWHVREDHGNILATAGDDGVVRIWRLTVNDN
ncbi:hypothetical protein BZG36_04160 [Bifiguratus adelaidae]|uniref:Probable cytosolic iron-sulfur protein assembly protein 1 n=1 Tax=Bifiguratus adelaidae TaxID=1938954 RepID=A0A261XWM0_9FUNG|nr:hypothetical protein BZG36_04160 [Bifiguratus adelaidae]